MVFSELGNIKSSSSLATVFKSYLEYYASGSGHTSKAKKIDLDKFLNFLSEFKGYAKVSKLKLADWNHSSTQRFVEESLAFESPATVGRRLATIKHCGRTLAEQVPGFTNPAKEVKTPKLHKAVPKSLDPKEIKAIRKKARERINNKDTFIRYRNQIIFSFLLESGLRADEVRLLKMSQLDQKLEWIKNVRTKGKRYRNVYISSSLQSLLFDYLDRRAEELKNFFPKLNKQIDKQLPLFISTYNADPNKPNSFFMGAKTVWRAINELSVESGLHPHLLRHTFALGLLESSNDIRLVSQALGHGDVRITMLYTERSDQEIAKAIEQKTRKSA